MNSNEERQRVCGIQYYSQYSYCIWQHRPAVPPPRMVILKYKIFSTICRVWVSTPLCSSRHRLIGPSPHSRKVQDSSLKFPATDCDRLGGNTVHDETFLLKGWTFMKIKNSSCSSTETKACHVSFYTCKIWNDLLLLLPKKKTKESVSSWF